MGISRESLESGKVLQTLISMYNDNPSEPGYLNVLCCLRDSMVYIPGIMTVSAADALQFANVKAGTNVTTHDEMHFKPDILQCNGKLYFPIFSNVEQLGEDYKAKYSAIQKHFFAALSLAIANGAVKGIVVNAFSDPFIVEKQYFDFMKTIPSQIETKPESAEIIEHGQKRASIEIKFVGQIIDEYIGKADTIQVDISDGGFFLFTFFNHITNEEYKNFYSDKFEMRITQIKNAVWFTVKFGESKWNDAPFSLNLTHLTNKESFTDFCKELKIVIVDTESGRVAILKSVVLDEYEQNLLAKYIQESYKMPFNRDQYDHLLQDIQNQKSTAEIANDSIRLIYNQ